MAREASRTGMSDVVCTPHLRDAHLLADGQATRALGLLADALRREHVPLHLHLGYELEFSFVVGVSPESLRNFAFGAQSQALLIEVPHQGWPAYASDLLFRLRMQGFTPILAHPERNDRFQRDPSLLPQLIASGAVAQGTCASLVGLFGTGAARTLRRHLEAGDIALLATDAHHDRSDTWSFVPALRRLAEQSPHIDIDLLVRENPRRLLAGETLVRPEPVAARPGAFRRLAKAWR